MSGDGNSDSKKKREAATERERERARRRRSGQRVVEFVSVEEAERIMRRKQRAGRFS